MDDALYSVYSRPAAGCGFFAIFQVQSTCRIMLKWV